MILELFLPLFFQYLLIVVEEVKQLTLQPSMD